MSISPPQVLGLDSLKPTTPRIDIYDHSDGTQAPAYAISPAVTALGSEYLFVGLGCAVVAVYSLATGNWHFGIGLVSELRRWILFHCMVTACVDGKLAVNLQSTAQLTAQVIVQ